MEKIGEKIFLDGLKDDRVKRIEELISKNNVINSYERLQIYGSMIFIIVFIIYYFLKVGNLNIHNMLRSYEFFFATIMLFVYNIALERATKNLKEEREKMRVDFKNKMILKVCKCDEHCECKDKLNDYMKNRGIKII